MNLYKCTCVGGCFGDSLDVYVVAKNTVEAEKKALGKMEELKYKYTRFVGKTELIAGPQYKAPAILAL